MTVDDNRYSHDKAIKYQLIDLSIVMLMAVSWIVANVASGKYSDVFILEQCLKEIVQRLIKLINQENLLDSTITTETTNKGRHM